MINVSGKIGIGKIVNQPGSSFNGELQEKYNVIIPGWLARNEDGSLWLYLDPSVTGSDSRKFHRVTFKNYMGREMKGWWELIRGYGFPIDKDLFPDVKWEDKYPAEVNIRIF